MSSREAFELGLHLDDAADAAHLVYADLLIARGDPHGELIALTIAHANRPDPRLERRIAELHAAHDATWLGPLHDRPGDVTWERGLVTRATITAGDYAAVLGLPGALLSDLTFVASTAALQPAVRGIASRGLPPSLATLRFDHGDHALDNVDVGELDALYPVAAHLRELDLAVGHMSLGAIDLPSLRSFDVWTGGFTRDNMASVTAARWPHLERLALRFGDPDEDCGAECTLEDVAPLLASAHLPALTHLGLGNAAFIDDAIPLLARSPLLPQLVTLDISLGTLTDAGAAALLTHADDFSHLAWIDVSDAFIREHARALASRLPVRHKGFEDPRHGTYCMIGEGYARSQRASRFVVNAALR
jgi:hypothetical protein